jgi:amidophosphoribosyltransferase
VSDQIKHECGIGLIRLLKPLEYYQNKYGSALWGLNKMYLLMEKQRNRGQDGAGLATIKLNVPPGMPYLSRLRSVQSSPWTQIFRRIDKKVAKLKKKSGEDFSDAKFLKQNFDFAGEVMLGHLRYGTHSANALEACHPVVRVNNWKNRSLVLAGNFNLTNVDVLFRKLVDLGQHPRFVTDTETVLERIGHFVDEENEEMYRHFREKNFTKQETARLISEYLDIRKIMKRSSKAWDGGYVMGGMIGNGDCFVARDPNGIRPCYYYKDDEIVVAASERAAISTVFNIHPHDISELKPGHVLFIKASSNKIAEAPYTKAKEQTSCSFERIYFSRGSDVDIYKERKALGRLVVPQILESIAHDFEHTVFSFIPNTAESAFWGMIQEVETHLNNEKHRMILELGPNPDPEELRKILNLRPRTDKAVLKDVKMRTFIADDHSRDDLVSHVYDVTQGVLEEGVDNLVCLDDSIVRGTTLKKSILTNLSRLKPKKIVIVSSAPQIRYPDCYGIDMSQIERLVAFQAAISLLKAAGKQDVIDGVYAEILALKKKGKMEKVNVVKKIYAPFSAVEVSAEIARIVTPPNFPHELDVIYQPLENLRRAMPEHRGDWYFSGDYPTPGGNRIVNQAFLNFYEGVDIRAYQFSLF